MGAKTRKRRLLSPTFTEALVYAAELHAGQQRKGAEPVPYVGHLMGVASMILELGGSETLAIAALLHDAVEDQPQRGRTVEEIRERFGPDVLRIVLACTDSLAETDDRGAATWRARKERYLQHVGSKRGDELFVSLADKLHNVRKILADLRREGASVWERFSGKKDGTLWYYVSLVDAFHAADLPPHAKELLWEFEDTVREIEEIARME